MPVFQEIQRELEETVTTSREETTIDIWIYSPGGSATAAYKIFLELRSYCYKLRAVIPDNAKSAATLLAIGCDEIYMAPAAELGPLDAQIEHPDRENVRVSALNVAKALGYLSSFANDFIVEGGGDIYQHTELPRLDVLREVSSFTAAFMEPIVKKLDPQLMHRATNDLDIARRYAVLMLENRNLSSSDEELRTLDDEDLAFHLVEGYPAHEFLISRSHATELGLPIKLFDEYGKWEEAKACQREFWNQLAQGGLGSLIEV